MRRFRRPSGLSITAVGASLLGFALVSAYLWGPLHASYERACEVYPHLRSIGPATLFLMFTVGLASLTLGVGGLVAGAVRSLWLSGHIQAMRAESPPRLLAVASGLGIDDRVICVEALSHQAFCYGLLKPKVCATRSMVDCLDPDELRAVLLHEREHLRARDPLRLLCAKALSRALFTAPIAGELYRWYLLRREVRADKASLESGERESLASALLKLIRSGTVTPYGAAGFNLLEERIRVLTGGKKSRLPLPLSKGVGQLMVRAGLGLLSFSVLGVAAPATVVGCLL